MSNPAETEVLFDVHLTAFPEDGDDISVASITLGGGMSRRMSLITELYFEDGDETVHVDVTLSNCGSGLDDIIYALHRFAEVLDIAREGVEEAEITDEA